MDFELDEAQQVIARSAADVLRGQAPPGAWAALAKAGLLSLSLPGWLDGDDLGVVAAAVLLTEVGRQAVPVPALATIMLGVLPVVRWGSRELQERLLSGVGTGAVILTAGVREPSTGMPAEPATVATETAGSVTVTGTKIGVPYAAEASWILVPASLDRGGRTVVVVDASETGVSVLSTPASGDVPEYTVRLTDAPVAGVLGVNQQVPSLAGPAQDAADDLYQLAAAGAGAVADGAIAGALALTTAHLATREQFGRPLATFQAVAQQVADVYITGRTLHLAALSACWRLATGRDAGDDADIAAYWLATEAPAALRTCHHLHGGIGLDISYPLHRYSAMINDLARFVGGAGYRLDLLGDRVRDEGGVACSSS